VKVFKEPRIFVGTLFCGESEFEACCKAIADQVDVKVKHHVIKNMPEMAAHNQLWTAWNNVKSNYDLFAKIDADTILMNQDSLKKVWNIFDSNPIVTGAQIMLHDYFTDSLIAGLNFFTPKVNFIQSRNRLMPDRVDRNHDCVLKGDDVSHLSPIGWHCKFPNPKQAFHYGLHRSLKKQKDVIKLLSKSWLSNRDNPREWALCGVLAANFWMRLGFDYNNRRFSSAFEKWNNDNDRTLKVEAFAKSLVKTN
jgi:hypothetical protein